MGMGAIALLPVLSSCSNVQTTTAQCAVLIHNGYFDARHVEAILLPGQRHNSNNVTTHYIYCNARNYIVGANGDDPNTKFISAKTAPDPHTGDGTPVDVRLTAYFTTNENSTAIKEFLPFCEKYNCFSPKDNTSNDQLDRSSAPGWENMLNENFPNAITRSVQQAMLQFQPAVWNDTSKWPKVADAISTAFNAQILTQTESTTHFFCGQGASATSCPPVRFSIEHIDPTDPQIRATYNQQVEQQQLQALAREQGKTNAAQLKAAKKKYGPLANYYLGLQDTIAACKTSATQCIVSLGQNATPTVNAGK